MYAYALLASLYQFYDIIKTIKIKLLVITI